MWREGGPYRVAATVVGTRYVARVQRPLAALLVATAMIAGCGGSSHPAPADVLRATEAAQGYVDDFGKRDGQGLCNHMTTQLQNRFVQTLTKANPDQRGKRCAQLMQAAVDQLPDEQVTQFASARIKDLRLDNSGRTGSFRYSVGQIGVEGQVAREGGGWKVSCCVPGQPAPTQ
jgi:hypothetical protein